jgi:hypothetical protein
MPTSRLQRSRSAARKVVSASRLSAENDCRVTEAMIDTPELCLQRRVTEYLSDPAAEFRDVATRFNALPVYSDVGGTLFVTPSLQILSMRSDETVVVEEHAPQWKLVALIAAAERFPELKQLLPVRPNGVSVCSICLGTGRVEQGLRCGACFGLGWPAERPLSESSSHER